MRKVKRWAVLLLAACLAFGLSVSAMAAEPDTGAEDPVISTFVYTNEGDTDEAGDTGDTENKGTAGDADSTQLTGTITDASGSEAASLHSAKTGDVSTTAFLVAVAMAAVLFAAGMGTWLARRRYGKEGAER